MLDLVGQGCGAAIPTLRAGELCEVPVLKCNILLDHVAASGIIASNPDAVVAVCCVEICRFCFPAIFCVLNFVSEHSPSQNSALPGFLTMTSA